MTQAGPHPARRRRGRFGPWLLLVVGIAMGVASAALSLNAGRPLTAPAWLTERIEARAQAVLGKVARIELGSLVAVLGEGGAPRLVLRDLRLDSPAGLPLAVIPEMRARFSSEAMLAGEVSLTRLTLVGAEVTLRRDRHGRLDLAFGTEGGGLARFASVQELLASVDAAFSGSGLGRLDAINGEAMRLTFQDALTGRVWRAEGGALAIRQDETRRSLTLSFSLAGPAGAAPARVRLALGVPRDGGAVEIEADVAGIAANDLAAQVPALAWLSAADAPLSAELRARVGAQGGLEDLRGVLAIGAGAIRPKAAAARPIPFEGASATLSYDPAAQRIDFTDVTARTEAARFGAEGRAYLQDIDPVSGLPERFLLQLKLADIVLDPEGELSEPARFTTGAADIRLSLDPFRLELGQLALVNDESRFRASGELAAEAEGWAVSLDMAVDRIAHDRLFALWPLRVVPQTRRWLVENVTEGQLYDVDAGLRLRSGEEPRLALGYQFDDGTVRFLRTLPPIVNGAGHAMLEGTSYTMALRRGDVVAPTGERIDASGSVLTVGDFTTRPAIADIQLRTRSTIPAALALLDQPPFEFMRKAGRGTDLASGRAEVRTRLRLPLANRLTLADIGLAVEGRLTDVRSDVVVPGRTLTADELTLTATNETLRIAGAGRIGEAVFDAAWEQGLGPEAAGKSRVTGEVTLDRGFLDEFGIDLPRDMVSGTGRGRITLDLARDQPPAFRLDSDLRGLVLSIPALAWSKGAGGAGTLAVTGRLGAPPEVDRLSIDAPGLSAEGRIALHQGGGLDTARFSRVRAGRWLDAPVVLTGRGRGAAPAVAVTGGAIDLRHTSFGGTRGGAGQGGPITLSLDRLTVSEGILFTGLRADLSTRGGLNGRFSGRLAGQAPVVGALAPSREGTAMRMVSEDAGAVLRAAGLLQSARNGVLDLTLVPLPGEGRYDGRFAVSGLSLRGAPALADLLGAISVVGLLEQLNGQGIVFTDVTGEFTLEPAGVTLRRGSAVGPSLGVSMAGIYDLRRKSIDMQGTISPIYMLNAIGQIFSRPGEGLFGFNYRMAGPTDNPRTSVNPLSILTPGMFREIFRSAPPVLTQ